jgi:hypothetical protein
MEKGITGYEIGFGDGKNWIKDSALRECLVLPPNRSALNSPKSVWKYGVHCFSNLWTP